MLLELNTVLVFANGLGIMALTAMAFGQVERTPFPAHIRAIFQGAIFGIGAVVAMLSPADVAEGIRLDARTIFVGFAGAFCGAPGAVAAMLIAGAARVALGGVGVASGLGGIILAGLAGLLWRRNFLRAGRDDFQSLLILGLMISSSIVSAVFLPEDVRLPLLLANGPAIILASIIAALALGTFIQREMGLVRHERALNAKASTDALTGLMNRRSFEERVTDALAGKPLASAMLLVDIDHFKAINDTYGHDAGDQVLRRVANILTSSVRQLDNVARIGGEEFAVFLPGISLHQAREVAARIRKSVEASKHMGAAVTVSIGLNWLPAPQDFRSFMAAADTALYAAKNSGRNRVTFSSMSPAAPA